MKKTLFIILSIIFLFASVSWAADATYSAGVYHKAGGDEEVVASGGQITVESGGELEVESGGILDVESGGYFKLAGTAVTATATEINKVAGVTAGTVTASKAVVVDANKHIDTLGISASGLKIGTSGSETAVTATGAELNFVASVTAGTASASKAAVLGTNKNLDEFHTAALYLGAGAGTLVTATAANLNAVPTATGTGTEIDAMTKNVYSSASTITLGAGGAVTQAAAIQLKDADGNAIAAVQKIRVYVSDDAAGATPATSGCNGAVTVSVGATLKVQTAKLDWDLVTDANGAVTLTFDNTGGGGNYTKYVVVVLPNGKVLVSAALNVATA